MNYRATKLYKTLDSFNACGIIEGFTKENATEEEILTAFQFLVDNGSVWKLQGFYGRTANDLIEQGIIRPAKQDHTDYYGNLIRGK